MFRFVLKKMINNRLMVGCLLAGFILAVAMVASIPLYTSGILQRLLKSDLESYQTKTRSFPGNYLVAANVRYLDEDERLPAYINLKSNLFAELIPQIPIPVLSVSEEVTIDSYEIAPAVRREADPKSRYITLSALEDMEEHIEILQGRYPSPEITDGTIEVIVTEKFLQENNLYPGEVCTVETRMNEPFTKAVIIGVFTFRDFTDTYWEIGVNSTAMYCDFSFFTGQIVNKQRHLLTSARWNIALDYHRLTLENIGTMTSVLETHHRLANRYRHFLSIDFKAEPILIDYTKREKQLRLILWIVNIPVLILIFFYLFMISHQILTNEQNEIAVLKSRGKSSLQVLTGYVIESLIISGIALIAGPPMGFAICRIMGASNGFLEFVRRAALPVAFNADAYLYSGLTLVFLIAVIVVPVIFRARMSIVELQLKKSGGEKPPLWKRYFIDVLILGIAGYGIFRYQSQENIMEITGASGIDIGIDPLLFLASTFFILGTGLLFLRLFPVIVGVVHHVGKKRWSPLMYAALLEVGRAGEKGQFLMLFLIFSIAIGICNANMARTLNRNIEDQVRYAIGADLTLQPVWAQDITSQEARKNRNAPSFVPEEEVEGISAAVHFREPSFFPYTQIEGTEKVTKVFTKTSGKALVGNDLITNVTVMGIVPHEFGEVAWFRNDLLPYHINNYLNLLADSPQAILVSENFGRLYKCREGDTISITWGDQDYLQGTIYAFVDYWPTYNPHSRTTFNTLPSLVVANLEYLQNRLSLEPYQIWLRKKDGAPDETVYTDIEQRKLEIRQMDSISQELIRRKNDPLLKGINGALTQGFILIMFVCAIGFLIYWMLSLRSRILQFGIVRAIGLTRREVMTMIVLEQLLMSGSAIFMGIVIGGIASRLFVPFLQLVFSSRTQVPPFAVIASRADYIKIYAIVGIILGTGLFLLRYFVRRLKIGRALKLGED
ncbi:MAG: ABC transporter permease [Spirochaetales bacterium]|nr:ABC transporter permease [Spirochaetales bacterium]